jgi:hypothetical protein
MKKWISLLFILALCGTLLPAVCSYDQKKLVLFSTVEEEQPEHGKEVKGKSDIKALLFEQSYLVTATSINSSYPRLFILFSDDPCMGNHTPPPDWFC